MLFEVPSNMLLKVTRPSIYISSLMFIWGIVNMCMGFIHNYQSLYALRFLLGVFEAGVLPGIIYITSMYYKRHEYQKRVSFFFCSTVVAGAFGGLIAFGIARLGKHSPIASWRWIFIIEGAMTSAIAIIASFLIIDWPEQTKWLSSREKYILQRRLASDFGNACHMDTLNKSSLRRIMTDAKIWLGAMVYLGIGVAGYAGAFFLPTILVEFKWTPEQAQLRTVPVYVFAGGIMVLAAWASDRLKHRFGFIVAGACINTLGVVMLLMQEGKSRDYKFAAIFPTIGGAFLVTPMGLGWLQNNLSGHWKRSFGAAIQVMLGNFSGIIGSNIFLQKESPRYITGYSALIGCMWFGTLSSLALCLVMWHENKKRDAGERDYRLQLPDDERKNLGDDYPSFRFTL